MTTKKSNSLLGHAAILCFILAAIVPFFPTTDDKVAVGDTIEISDSDTEYVCKIVKSDGGLVLDCLD